ncbi:MAG TPA: hypothetical protein VKY31_03775, partial [Terriglobia bacterium]|nr:hypothetical protein [Terriglobia bacterium]
MMHVFAAGEVIFVFVGVMAYIWRLQYSFPDFAVILLAFIIVSFLLHRDGLKDLGLGSQGFVAGLRVLALPTALIALVLIVFGIPSSFFTLNRVAGLGKYFAWCLLQEFALQSFFGNRLLLILRTPNRAAWVNAALFGIVH